MFFFHIFNLLNNQITNFNGWLSSPYASHRMTPHSLKIFFSKEEYLDQPFLLCASVCCQIHLPAFPVFCFLLWLNEVYLYILGNNVKIVFGSNIPVVCFSLMSNPFPSIHSFLLPVLFWLYEAFLCTIMKDLKRKNIWIKHSCCCVQTPFSSIHSFLLSVMQLPLTFYSSVEMRLPLFKLRGAD